MAPLLLVTLGACARSCSGTVSPSAAMELPSTALVGPERGIPAHDPTLVREGERWYLFQTGRGIQASRSKDAGRSWEAMPPVIRDRPPWWDDAVPGHHSLDAWAPDVWNHRGRSWLAYSISTFGSNESAIGLLSAQSLEGPWRDEGLLVRSTSSDDFNAIDPELVADENGAPWLAFGSFWSGIQLVSLDGETLRPRGARHVLASRPEEGVEAPTLVHRAGYWYLLVSAGRCCRGLASTYRIAAGRASAITGPYVDRRGKDMREGGGEILFAGDARWKGPGGQDFTSGEQLVFHSYDGRDGGKSKLLMMAIAWDADGWPRLGQGDGRGGSPSSRPSADQGGAR